MSGKPVTFMSGEGEFFEVNPEAAFIRAAWKVGLIPYDIEDMDRAAAIEAEAAAKNRKAGPDG